MGQKIIKIAAGVAGLVIVFVLGKWIAAQIYHRTDVETEASSRTEVQAEPEAVLVRTEEELEALYRSIKETAVFSGQSEENIGILSTENPTEASDIPSEQENSQNEVDFEYLWTVNKDIIAWITIPGTNIDYPILQHSSDDTYYLNHNIDGSSGYPGCIYIEGLNSADFTDPNTVIYGHNLKAKTIFQNR